MTLANKLLKRFRGPEAKRYWTEVLILLVIGFPTCGGTMLLSIYTAITVIDVSKNLTTLEEVCGLTIFVFIPFLFAYMVSYILSDQVMKRIPMTKSQSGKLEDKP